MKVVEIRSPYFVVHKKDQPIDTWVVVNEYTMVDANLEFLEKIKEMVALLSSITTVEEIVPEGSNYKLSFTTSVFEEDVKKEICNVYTHYLRSERPLIYPFHDDVVNTPNPSSFTRESTNHLASIFGLCSSRKEITGSAHGSELSLVCASDFSSMASHPRVNAMRKVALSARFFQQANDGSLASYIEETQHRYDGKYTVFKKGHRGYQFDEAGNIDEYCSDDESFSYK